MKFDTFIINKINVESLTIFYNFMNEQQFIAIVNVILFFFRNKIICHNQHFLIISL